jgi:hypothetical protein
MPHPFSVLWGQPALLVEAEQMVERIADLIDRDDLLDVIAGSAGCVVACSISTSGGLLSGLAVAVQCDRLT